MTLDSQKIKVGIILLFGAFAALYLGISAATAQMEAVIWTVGGISLSVCLLLGRRIWLLLPFMTSLGLVLPIKGFISTMVIAQILVIGFCTLLFLMRKLPMHVRFTELEAWSLLFILCVAQAYMRNPVGLNIFGGENVGGKPYVMFSITILTSYILSILRVPPIELKWYIRAVMLGSWINFSLGGLGKLVPGVGQYLGASFSNDVRQDEGVANRDVIDTGAASRVAFVRGISLDLSNWICCRVAPLRACFHPIWGAMILFTLAAAAYSGFRSQFAVVGGTYLVGILYRGGMRHLIIAMMLIATALCFLALVNAIKPLPPNVQRSLTFLPGTWEERYKRDADESTEWRVQMWVDALSSDRYIKNRILGDGLGMTAEQWRAAGSKATTVGNIDAHRESAMQAGDYHSGPVHTIRVVGYVGLIVLLCGLVRLAVHAHRQILRCRNTEWFPAALFIGSAYVWFGFGWTFVFGSFLGGASALIMGSALIRMMENNLPLPAYVVARRQPYILKSLRQVPADGRFSTKR